MKNMESYAATRPSIQTTLNGCGRARLDFGNCNCKNIEFMEVDKIIVQGAGYTQVSLNDVIIGNETYATASCNELSKKIEFDFQDGDTLELIGGGPPVSFIRFNRFEVISCCNS